MIYVIDRQENAVLSLRRADTSTAARPTFEPLQLIAGGNPDFPLGQWYEGTASKVNLWGPTFGTFANEFIRFRELWRRSVRSVKS